MLITQKSTIVLTALVAVAAFGLPAVGAEEATSYAAVAKALPVAKVTLQQGLTASESTGQPISAKFEVDEGHLQLSVYTAKGGAFYEIVVDHVTGAVAKSEAISEADDLTAAKAQMAVMTKAKKSLTAAVDAAEAGHAGYRAVGVTPATKGRQVVAVVLLLKGSHTQSVTESLE